MGIDSTVKETQCETVNESAIVHQPQAAQVTYPKYMTGVQAQNRQRWQTCVPIEVGGKSKVALWDTGAELSIVSKDVCCKLGLWKHRQTAKATAKSVCQQDIQFDGRVLVKFQVAGTNHEHTFHIWSQCPFDMILGTDFMKTCGTVSIDHCRQEFWFSNNPQGAVKLVNNTKKYAPVPVSVLENVEIPPRCACQIAARCHCDGSLPDVPVYFEGSFDAQERTLLRIAQVVTRVENG